MSLYTSGQQHALIKLGFGPEDATKLFKATKKYKLPKAGVRQYSRGIQSMLEDSGLLRSDAKAMANTAYSIPGAKRSREAFKPLQAYADRMSSAVTNPGLKQQISDSVSGVNPALPPSSTAGELQRDFGAHGQSWISMGKGDVASSLQGLGTLPDDMQNTLKTMSPEKKRMLNAVMEGHELDELKTKPKVMFRGMGHVSPDVILREHNKLVTLPDELKGITDILQPFRQNEKELLNPYMQYGQGERLSRHARKRITDMLERDAEKVQLENFKNYEKALSGP